MFMNPFLNFSSVYPIDIYFIFHVHPPVYSNTSPHQTISDTLTVPTPSTIAYSYQLYNTIHYYLCNGWHQCQRTRTAHCSTNIAKFADISILIMMWLINKAQLLVLLLDIPILQPGDIDIACMLFIQQYQTDIEHHNMWTPVISNWLKHIILWFQSYGCTFGECPNVNALCAETLCIIPEDFAKSMINDEHDADACMSYVPGQYTTMLINRIKL